MPQLVKGGKYIFGWSAVSNKGVINIPDEAFLEYAFNYDDKGILMSGSKRSGGFGLSSERLLKNTPIEKMLINYPDVLNYQLTEGEIKQINKRIFSWVGINQNRSIKLSESLLKVFNFKINTKLLVGRGSGIALGFIAKGPIYEEAKKHPEIPLY